MSSAALPVRPDISLYRQVGSILREQIAEGILRPGDRLPAEGALSAAFRISRGTVRQALEALQRDGLIERAPGRGTFVRAGPARQNDGRTRLGHPAMREMAARAIRLVRSGSAPPPPAVTQALSLARSDETPFMIRVAPRTPHPLALKRYLHPSLSAQLDRLAAADDFDAALAKVGQGRAVAGPAWVEAVLAEPRFAMLLKVSHGSPLLSVWFVDMLDDKPVACSQMLLPGGSVAVDLTPERR